MMRAILALLCTPVVALEYTPEALEDEIHDLPGIPSGVKTRMFSGYIDVSALGDPAGTKELFYWFVECQKDPDNAPLILWTNGGPGCSGLAGFLTENGPFRVGYNGTSLVHNSHSWNKLANMIFIEQPAGVGFSHYKAGKFEYSDQQCATDNRQFIMKFFERYPALQNHPFYLSSESYGGHYLPTLAKELVEKGGAPGFKGVAVGNPLTYMPYRDYGFYGTAWGHQLLPKYLWDQYVDKDCSHSIPASEDCQMITSKMNFILQGLDPYALDFPSCVGGEATGQQERLAILDMIARATNRTQEVYQTPGNVQWGPCSEDLATNYLNLPEVKTAIHAKDFTWQLCSGQVNWFYNTDDTHAPMMPYWKFLIETAKLNLMIFSGDDDSICATLGTQQFIWELGCSPCVGAVPSIFKMESWEIYGNCGFNFSGYEPNADQNWKAWKVEEQIAGYYTEFNVPAGGKFAFVTVHGAGHMVPSTQPKRALALLENFLEKTVGETSLATM